MADIYDEVLADRKRLQEVAEKNAKEKILNAVTPRIKELVENAILGRLDEDMPGDDEDILLGVVDGIEDDSMDPTDDAPLPVPGAEAPLPVEPAGMPVDPSAAVMGADAMVPPLPGAEPGMGGEPAGLSLPDAEGKVTLDIDSLTSSPGGQFELTPESIKALNALIGIKQPVDIETIESRTARLESVTKKIAAVKKPSIKNREQARQLKRECSRIFSDIQQTRDFLDEGWVTDVESRLENVFRVVMERYSAAGHLQAIARAMLAVNRRAGSFNSLTESRNLTGDDFSECVEMLQQTQALHESVRRLHESLADDDSVDGVTVRQVGANLATLYMEIRKMVTKKGKRIVEADDLDLGAGDDMGDMGAEMGGDDMGAEAAEKMLVQLELPASLKDIAAGDQVSVVDVSPAGEDDGLDDMGGADADMGGDDALGDLEADIGDEAGGEEEEEMPFEADERMYEAKLSDDDIIEIDEAALVAEMQNMKKLREKKYAVRHGGHGPGDLSDFGGGKGEGEKFVDGQDLNQSDDIGSDGYLEEGDEDDLDESDDDLDEADDLDEGDDDLDEADDLDEGDDDLDEAFVAAQKKKASAKNARPKGKQLAEAYEKARVELAEQKLFNTKLVALNRVLQIPGLKKAQKVKVVEVLDKGRTMAEVQQLYSKIVEALKKDATVTESADKSSKGAGSKVITSTSPSDKGESHPLLEKWNKIAFGGSGVIQG